MHVRAVGAPLAAPRAPTGAQIVPPTGYPYVQTPAASACMLRHSVAGRHGPRCARRAQQAAPLRWPGALAIVVLAALLGAACASAAPRANEAAPAAAPTAASPAPAAAPTSVPDVVAAPAPATVRVGLVGAV